MNQTLTSTFKYYICKYVPLVDKVNLKSAYDRKKSITIIFNITQLRRRKYNIKKLVQPLHLICIINIGSCE